MDHIYIYTAFGFAIILMSWLPSVSKRIKISYPILLLLIGALLYFMNVPISWPNPLWKNEWIMYISEIIVIVSLMGSGLKIGKNYSLKDWSTILRLIVISVPIFLLGTFLFGYFILGISLSAAVLLAAVLSPTDPVLASEVQIDDIRSKKSLSSKFALTGEAGINDGLGFPFTILALGIFAAGNTFDAGVFVPWFFDSFLLRIFLGCLAGYIFGKIFGSLIEKIPQMNGIGNPLGFIALAITFFVYGATEILHGYGFLAVFVCAVVIRHCEEMEGSIKQKMHDFTDETEKLLLVVWIILFGGAVLNGLFDLLVFKDYIFALFIIFLLRPVSTYLGLIGSHEPFREKLFISFFGIRGIGSLFYLSWAFVETPVFPNQEKLYAIVSLVVLLSIIIHGVTVPFFVEKLEEKT